MLLLTQDAGSTEIILTLTEKVTLNEPNYLFVFTHIESNDVIAFVKLFADDTSLYPARFNLFEIDVASLFTKTGFYEYKVYEQADETNTDESLTGALLEQGKMKLLPAAAFAMTTYTTDTTYKAYAG